MHTQTHIYLTPLATQVVCWYILFKVKNKSWWKKWTVFVLQANTQLLFPLPPSPPLVCFSPGRHCDCGLMWWVTGTLSLSQAGRTSGRRQRGWWSQGLGAEGVNWAPSPNADGLPAHPAALKPKLASFLEATYPKYACKRNRSLLAEQLTLHFSGVWGHVTYFFLFWPHAFQHNQSTWPRDPQPLSFVLL